MFFSLGPKVVSHQISVESIVEVSSVLRRPPVIWDNIHANDYDPQRLFLGPYKVNLPVRIDLYRYHNVMFSLKDAVDNFSPLGESQQSRDEIGTSVHKRFVAHHF